MPHFKPAIAILALSFLATAYPIHASKHEHEHEQHDAHVHGEAELLLAIEGDTLEIEFHSPAMNIVGFEHQPNNPAQTKAVMQAMETLSKPELLFTMPADAGCTAVSTEVESPLAEHDGHAAENGHKEEEHSDFAAHYHYQCTKIDQLGTIEVQLFQRFPGTESIEVQSISSQGQKKFDLTAEQAAIEL